MNQFRHVVCRHLTILETSSDYTHEGDVPHYAYLVLRIFPPFPTEIAVLCHHARTNDIFLCGGRVGPSSITRENKVEMFLVKVVVLQIGFRLPSDFSSTMCMYWERKKQIPCKEGMLRASGPQWVCTPILEGCESSWGELITREEPPTKVLA